MFAGLPFSESADQQALLAALILGSARLFGVMMAFPAFTQAQVEGLIRFCVAVALSLPVVLATHFELRTGASFNPVQLLLLSFKEVVVGLLLGVVLGLPFWALQAAGDLIDQSRGASQANVSDPVNASETTVTGQFLMIVALLFFATSDGLMIVLRAVHDSYQAWPVLSFVPPPSLNTAQGLGAFLAEVVRLGFVLGAPLLLGLFIIDLAVGFLGRFAQQLQITELSSSFKNLLVVALLPILMLFMNSYILPQFKAIGSVANRFLWPG
ncbi:MAG: type III secretion system export apparatus subunit SctT [Beijerinckiaceae bacterium]